MEHGARDLLRHLLATLAYRTRKSLQGAPAGFASFAAGSGVRTPHALLNHMSNLIGFTIRGLRGDELEVLPEDPDFGEELTRFHGLLSELSDLLEHAPLEGGLGERLLQGPLSDAMTHVGQLALLRRLAGAPVAAENFFAATIDTDDLGTAR